MWWRTIVVVLVAASVSNTTRAAHAGLPDVVLIVIDTLRADRLGVYGNERGLTPFLDAFARGAHVFERAYAQAPWTNPSVASLFTSRYLSQHGVVGFDSVLAAEETTLAEVLKQAGYGTGAFSANGLISRKAGFDQGFDVYRAHLTIVPPAERFTRPAKRADEITGEALAWLDTLGRPGARPPVAHAQPACGCVIGLSRPIPHEADANTAHLVDVDLLTGRPDHERAHQGEQERSAIRGVVLRFGDGAGKLEGGPVDEDPDTRASQ